MKKLVFQSTWGAEYMSPSDFRLCRFSVLPGCVGNSMYKAALMSLLSVLFGLSAVKEFELEPHPSILFMLLKQ